MCVCVCVRAPPRFNPLSARHGPGPLAVVMLGQYCPQRSADACVDPPAPTKLSRNAILDGRFSLVISLSSSDSLCVLNRSMHNALRFTSPETLLVLHISCQSSTRPVERGLFARLSPRLVLNPRCIAVRSKTGSILHAHLLNMALVRRHLGEGGTGLPPPRRLLLQSADTIWIGPGVEEFALQRVSSVLKATAMTSSLRARLARSLPHLVGDGVLSIFGANTSVLHRFEGSFYPWWLASRFFDTVCSRWAGRMADFDARAAEQLEAGGDAPVWLSVEDLYLPTFAAAQLNLSGAAAAPSLSRLGASSAVGQVVGFGGLFPPVRNGSWRVMHCGVMQCANVDAACVTVTRGNCSSAKVFARKIVGIGAHTCAVPVEMPERFGFG